MSSESLVPVAVLGDIPDPGVLGVELPNGERVCLIRRGDMVTALSDECTHQAFPMSAGEVLTDGSIQCSWHGARFDCVTGAVCEGPAEESLPTYDVRVDGAAIFVGARRQ